MSFIGEHEDVRCVGEERVLLARAALGAAPRLLQLLELLHRREDCLAGRVRQKVPKVTHALRLLGVGESAGPERPGNLDVEVLAVRQENDGRVLVGGVTPQLQGEPQHREALSTSLGVPDDTPSFGGLLGPAGTVDGLVHRGELLVPAKLADGAAGRGVALEHDEVLNEVEEVCWREHPLEKNLLCRGGMTSGLGEVGLVARPHRLPLRVEAMRCSHGAVRRGVHAGRDQNLDRLEELRRPQVAVPRLQLLVAGELVDGLRLPTFGQRRALALDDRERDAVHQDDDVGADVFLGALDAVLPGDDELVLARVVEVDEADRVSLLSVSTILLERDAVGQGGVEPLARLDEGGCGRVGDGPDRFLYIVLGEPGVEPLDSRGEPLDHDHLLERLALPFQRLGRDEGVAEGFELLDCRILGQVLLVPAFAGRGHCFTAGPPSGPRNVTSPAQHVAESVRDQMVDAHPDVPVMLGHMDCRLNGLKREAWDR